MSSLLPLATLTLIAVSFLWPTEDAVNGQGLFFVLLWLLVWTLERGTTAISGLSSSNRPRSTFGAADWGVLLIVAGHIISTWAVFQAHGDRRSALNLTFEWLGLLAAFRMMRTFSPIRLFPNQLAVLLIVIAAGLAALGIWQHHVFYPRQADWYRTHRSLLDDAVQGDTTAGGLDVAKAMAALREENIPLDGPERVLWENRLLSSSEPFATFSLANTLAGVLSVGMVLVLAVFFDFRKARPRIGFVNMILLVCLLATLVYCLVLTKSRSAWAGAFCGITILALGSGGVSTLRRVMTWGAAIGVSIILLFGAALMVGVIDKEVILESPRSLQFRLLYWSGTAKMLKERPLVGAGPGNFRQLYLTTREDESSEEIRDPHNVFLDAWSSAGLTGLAGMLLIVVSMCRQLRPEPASVTESPATGSSSEDVIEPPLPPVAVATIEGQKAVRSAKAIRRVSLLAFSLGFMIHFGWRWLNGSQFSFGALEFWLPACGVIFIPALSKQMAVRFQPLAGTAAAAALLVHLLASGGFEMPAVMICTLACCNLGLSGTPRGPQVLHPRSHRLLAAAMCGILLSVVGGVFQFGLKPVWLAERLSAAAEMAMNRFQNPRRAVELLTEAARLDPLAVAPRQRMAQIESYSLNELLRNPSEANDESESDTIAIQLRFAEQFQRALDRSEDLIAADIRNCFALELRAQCHMMAFRGLGETHWLVKAVEDYQAFCKAYPSSVFGWVNLAMACAEDSTGAMSEVGAEAALRALKLDAINREWGHRELYLTELQVNDLQTVVQEK
jgi:O-antigen ligase